VTRRSDCERYLDQFGPDGLIAVLRDWVTEQRLGRIDDVLEHRIQHLTVAVVGLYDPHNGAAVIRTCEGMGLSDVHAADEQGEPMVVSHKVALGGHKWLSIHRHPTFEALLAELKPQGFALWAAVPGSPTQMNSVEGRDRSSTEGATDSFPGALVDVRNVPVEGPLALVFGNERDGLSPDVIARCDGRFSLPMWGFTASYNLSVSVGMALQAVVPRFRQVMGRNGDLSPEAKRDLRARWLFSMVRAAAQILDRARADRSEKFPDGATLAAAKGTDNQ